MSELVNNIPLTIPEPKPEDYKKKRKMALTDIGEKRYINRTKDKSYPIKIPISSKEEKWEMISRKT